MQLFDLAGEYQARKSEYDQAIGEVLVSGRYVLGQQLDALESELAAFCGAQACCGVANGSDALLACLEALGIEPGDHVLVPDFTFFATAEMVVRAGAVPVFADVDPSTFHVTERTLEAARTQRTVGAIVVSLFGRVAPLPELRRWAKERNLWLLEDGAQSFGARRGGSISCAETELATTSFYPTKPLGCFGDGGAVFGRSDLVEKVRRWRDHGQTERGVHVSVGVNSRLDEIQAAILRVKLRHFSKDLRYRRQLSEWYLDGLAPYRGILDLPEVQEAELPTWAQFTVRAPALRDALHQWLRAQGIPTAIHYPRSLRGQDAFAKTSDFCLRNPETDRACREVLSLPLHGVLSQDEVAQVVGAIGKFVKAR